ncbi:adenine phosphoribosyltransferase [Candidatus Marsarchaeota archaeon]|jgi:adenine phosphoribosyltransferase|nr:adenine phosphoribosyltransferase [Candidatus Marsarchaeota archaeon]
MEKTELTERIKSAIVDVPDYPKKGIMFKDITGLFASHQLFKDTMHALAAETVSKLGFKPDFVAGIEARGFIIGTALADEIGVGFVPIRKAGKLPRDVVSESYDLEYGSASIELQKDSMPEGSRVLIADDLLATGGTASAAEKLIKKQGSKPIGFAFIIVLSGFGSKDALKLPVFEMVEY